MIGSDQRGSSAMAEIGPAMPSRFALRQQAMEAARIAAVITDITVDGPGCDLARAARLMARLRAVVGTPGNSEGDN